MKQKILNAICKWFESENNNQGYFDEASPTDAIIDGRYNLKHLAEFVEMEVNK